MIIKILPRHSPSYASLISYILKEGKGMNEKPEVITHNLRSTTAHGWTQEFALNETFRKQSRSDQVHLYHDILSFSSNEDTTKITKEMLDDISRRYIQLRGYDGMYVGAVHKEKEHIHIHFCTSGVKFRTGQAFRLSHEQMRTLKTELQQYHQKKYPELTESICRHGIGNHNISHQKWHAVEKKERHEVKEMLTARVQECFHHAHSQKDFITRLNGIGIPIYERNGKPTGIIHGETKFRFSRLGINIQELPQQIEKENNKNMERKQQKSKDEEKILQELRTEERTKEEKLYREIIYEKDGGTETVQYNDIMKETIFRNADGKETVRFERIDDTERERLDALADSTQYYTDLNDQMGHEEEASTDSIDQVNLENDMCIEDGRTLDELDELRESNNDERDIEEEIER